MANSQSIEDFKSQPRLPRFAVPRRYDLFLKPDLSSCTFTGSTAIAVDVVEDTRFLVLNAADLSIETGSVCFKSSSSSEAVRPSKVVLLEQDEILVLQFDELLPRGNGVLGIDFQGRLNDNMKGFYKSVYEHNGEKKNMAVTQFEPADARRCFPCWDEPAFKASRARLLREKAVDPDIQLVCDDSNIYKWTALIKGPSETPYEGGVFQLAFAIPEQYPLLPPQVRFLTKIFHPNVHFKTGEICLDILKNAPAWTLQSVCRAIIALMAHSEPDSPLNCDSGNLLRSGDIRGYRSMAKMYTRLAAMPKKG